VEQADVFRLVIEVLDRLKVPYMVVGSAASSIYGEPRLTQDIDIVIDPTAAQLDQLCAAFPQDDFYVSPEAAREALASRAQFNIIHPHSGNKIDFMIAGEDAWGRSQLARRRRVPVMPALEGVAAAPEDVIIAKMLYYQEGGSEKHLRDITGMLRVSDNRIDRQYIRKWAEALGVTDVWEAIEHRLRGSR
jgi:hypothetical protein